MTIKILGRRGVRKLKLPARTKVIDLLNELGFNPMVVVVRRNGKIVVEGDLLKSGDLIEVVPIVTGG